MTRFPSLTRMLPLALVPMMSLAVSHEASAGTWTVQKENLASILMGIDFLDDQNGYVAGATNGTGNAIFRTLDGGRTWTNQVDNMQVGSYLDIAFGDSTHAVSGGLGMYYRWAGASYTTDGRNWSASKDRWLVSAYQDVDAVDAEHMWLIGMWAKATTQGYGVAASTDGGRTFNYFDWGIDTSPRYGSFISPSVGYISGGQWPYEETAARFGKGDYRVNHRMRLRLPAVEPQAAEYDGWRGVIAKTVNGGESWELLYDDYDRFYFNGVQFLDEEHGWAVAEGESDAYVLHTSDGGVTWEEQHVEASASLMQIKMVDSDEGWAVGAKIEGRSFTSLFLHTVDGGQSWQVVDTGLKYFMMNLDIVDADHIWAVGANASGAFAVLKYTP